MTVLNGVDVSHFNKITDWVALSRAVGFVIAKASQGLTFVDTDYAANRAAAEAHKVPFGAYHYAAGGSAVAEAEHFLAAAKLKPGEIAFLDIEGPILKHPDLVAWVVAWLTRVKASLHVTPLTYMSESVVKDFDWRPVVALGAGEWVAEYGPAKPPSVTPFPFAAIWQHTSKGRVAGITGNVDLDTFYGDAHAWALYGGAGVKPAVKPAAPVHAPAAQRAGTIEVQDWRLRPPVIEYFTPAELAAKEFAYISNASGRAQDIAEHLGITPTSSKVSLMTTTMPVSVAASALRTWISRTGVPFLVALLFGWLANRGIHLSGAVEPVVDSAIGSGAGFLYALAVHLLERKWPFLSVLLGSKKQPDYVTPVVAPTEPAAP